LSDTQRADAADLRYVVTLDITEEPLPSPALEAMARSDRQQVEQICAAFYDETLSTASAEQLLDEVNALLDAYPDVPTLYQYKQALLERLDRVSEANAVIDLMLQRFPKYVFAFIAHVHRLLRDGQLDEAEAFINKRHHPAMFDPDRKQWHITEVVPFLACMCEYLCFRGEPDRAQPYLDGLKSLVPEHPVVKSIEENLMPVAAVRKGLLSMMARAGKSKHKRGSRKRG